MFNSYPKKVLITVILLINSAPLLAENSHHYNLPQAIDYALINNPNLQIMRDKVTQAETQLGIALSHFYPNIKTRLSYQHSNNPAQAFAMIISQRRLDFSPSATTDFNNPGGIDNYRPEITASYSLFRGGQDYFQSKAAQLGVEAASLETTANHNRLIQAVSSTFYAYLAAIEVDKVADRSITAVENELKQSQIRYQAGSLLRSDVLSLDVQLAEAQGTKIQTHNAIELAKISLQSLLGIHQQESFTIDHSNHWLLPKIEQPFEQLLNLALTQRPEILAAQKQIEIAQQQLNAAKGAYLPTADAYVSYGSDSKDLDFSSNRDNVTAGITVELDIFSGFRHKGQIKKARYQLAISQKSAKKIQLYIESSVKTAHLKLLEALARFKVTSASVTAAEEAFRLVNEQRKAGTATVTRYIEAKVAREQSHARHIAARFDALRAETELKLATGS